MYKKISIKDIAQQAGVSPGTVDRVIHGRGNVSESSRIKVEGILEKVDYKPNLQRSSISIKRHFKITIAIPAFFSGDYWEKIKKGCDKAIAEYNKLDIECEFLLYNQYDLYLCREVFDKIKESKPDGVVIGPIFKNEVMSLAAGLDELNIPYVYVDSHVEGTNPIASFSSEHYKSGQLIAKLLDQITPKNKEVVLFDEMRISNFSSNTSDIREQGFNAYFKENNSSIRIHKIPFSVFNPEQNNHLIGDYFAKNPNIKGGAVLSSRGSVIADYFKANNLKDIKLVCFDLTARNTEAISQGLIDFVLCQHPIEQGFLAFKSLILRITFGERGLQIPTINYMPLDILTKENLEFYRTNSVFF